MMQYNFIDIAEDLTLVQHIDKIKKEIFPLGCNVTINFCSEKYMVKINSQSLNHQYPTDIITFFYNETEPEQDAELLICPEVVKSNSFSHNTSYMEEVNRVIAHGLLHLKGFQDKTENEKKEMRNEENKILDLLFPVEHKNKKL